MFRRVTFQLVFFVSFLEAIATPVTVDGSRVSAVLTIDSMMATKVWDFSEGEIFSRAKFFTDNDGDSLLMEFLPVLRTDFRTVGNQTNVKRLEGRDWFFNIDSMGSVPSSDSQSIHGQYRKYQQTDERFDGLLALSESYGHTAIFSAGDTLRNVLAVELNIKISIYGHSPDSLVSNPATRTNIFRIVRLYASESDFPIAVCMESDYNGRLADGSTVYIFPLTEHPSQYQLASRPQQKNRPHSPPSRSAYNGGDDGNHGSIQSIPQNAITVSTDGNTLTVSTDCHLLPADIMVYDISGRLLSTQRITSTVTTFTGIPSGEILFTLYPDDKTILPSYKIFYNPH